MLSSTLQPIDPGFITKEVRASNGTLLGTIYPVKDFNGNFRFQVHPVGHPECRLFWSPGGAELFIKLGA